MYKAGADVATSATSPLAPSTIPRRDPTDRDVRIEVLFCGICHSDLHTVLTYNGPDGCGTAPVTYGGYSGSGSWKARSWKATHDMWNSDAK